MKRCRGWLVLVSGLLLAHYSLAQASGPNLASVNAAVAEVGANTLVYGKNADRSVPVASITKLMTALVVMSSGESLDKRLEFYPRHQGAAANAYTRIRVGSTLPRADVLRIALMSSENFAAYTLARHHPGGYEAFVTAMNEKARELGMRQTRFVDPTGLSLQNRSTAADLVRLVEAALAYPAIMEYSTTGYFTGHFRKPRYDLAFGNTSVLVHRGSWGVSLSKTGYLNDAGRCLVMVAEMNGKPMVTVLLDSLGTRSPLGDAGRIRHWLATGEPGTVAAAAKDYEQNKNLQYAAKKVTQ